MVLAFDLADVNTILTMIMLVLTVASTLLAIIFKIKAGDWKGAAEEAGKLLGSCTKTIDNIKTKTEGTPARAIISDTLKTEGVELEKAGLKDAMDAKLRELGLTEES